jgi:hypothetical protein
VKNVYNVPQHRNFYSNYYARARNSNNLQGLHVPLSDVYYVKAKISEDTGVDYSAEHVEISMWLEGLLPVMEVKALPDWYVDEFLGGVEPDFAVLQQEVKAKYRVRMEALKSR